MAIAIVNQNGSGVEEANEAGLQHGSTHELEVVVGATPERTGTALHFCSSRMKSVALLQMGNGNPVPEESRIVVEDIPSLSCASFLVMNAEAHSNGALSFSKVRNVRSIPVPAAMLQDSPWAWDGGFEAVAQSLGKTTDDLIATAQPVA